MDARDKSLEDMMNMEPWEVITKRHSKGSIYRAWPEFEKKVAERVANLNNEIADLVEIKAKNELELKSVKEKHTKQLDEISSLEEKISELESNINIEKNNLEEVELALASANENLNARARSLHTTRELF